MFLRKFRAILQQPRRNILLHPYQTTPPRQLILLRHGETCWDKKKIFDGWYDVNLTDYGRLKAFCAGRTLRNEIELDCAFSSCLTRAHESLQIVLEEMNQCPDVKLDWRLNERHFGELTGFEEKDMRCTAGDQQVDEWTKDFYTAPPPISEHNPYYCEILQKFNYIAHIPQSETIKTTKRRVLRFWFDEICPKLKLGQRILVVGHDFTLKSIIQHLEEFCEEDLGRFKVPRCMPIEYRLDYYLRNIANFSPKFWGELKDVGPIADTWGKCFKC